MSVRYIGSEIKRYAFPKIYLQMKYRVLFLNQYSFPSGSDGKEPACNAGDLGSIPGLGRAVLGWVTVESQHNYQGLDSFATLAPSSSASLRLSWCLSLQGCRTAAPHSPGSRPGLFPLTQLFRILLELFSRSCPNRPYLMSHGPKVGYFAPP